ncbi:MAG: MFS transporter [Neisseriaceae bacterium]|nr:MFS transporter [Neisseriaceae bacterium]
MNKILSIFSLEKNEIKLLFYSVLMIFLLFAAYAFLRPIRESLGIENSTTELKWLFFATFIFTLICSLLAMNLSGRIKRKLYADGIFIFFAVNLIIFYVAMLFIPKGHSFYPNLCRIFYVWISIFNMFVISTAWSVLADSYTKERSMRLFGIISAGASFGQIIGSSTVAFLGHKIATQNFIFIAGLFLIIALILKNLIIKESSFLINEENEKQAFLSKFNIPLPSKNPFEGIKIVFQSNYLMLLALFIILLTSVSTFLYMEQARIVQEYFPKTIANSRELRTALFAKIDFIVQTLSFMVQIFLTAKIAKYCGSKYLLSVLGFVLCIGFVVLILSGHALWAIILVFSLRRVGEYALVKPAREMLFVPLDAESKYKVKNFTDTVVYRAGDALSSQLESILSAISTNIALAAGGIIALLWGFTGLRLSQKYEQEK